MIYALVLAAIAAPSGFIVGQIASEQYELDGMEDIMPWLCAALLPLNAVVAISLILKATLVKEDEL